MFSYGKLTCLVALQTILLYTNVSLCKWISVSKLQTAATHVGEYKNWNPWSWSTWNSLEKCINAHELHVTLTDASRDLHGTFT